MVANSVDVRENFLKYLKCSSWQVKCYFDDRDQNFFSKSENNYKFIIFSKKYFSSRSCSGQVECSLNNRAERFSGFFWKKRFFEDNFGFLRKSVKLAALLLIAYRIISFQKIGKFLNMDELQNLTKKQWFSGLKNDVILLKSIFSKIGERKICRR